MKTFDDNRGIFIMFMCPYLVTALAELEIENREICLSLFKEHLEAVFQRFGIDQFRRFEVRFSVRHQWRPVAVEEEVIQRQRKGMDSPFFQFGIKVMRSRCFTGAGRPGQQDNLLFWKLAGEAVCNVGYLFAVTFFRQANQFLRRLACHFADKRRIELFLNVRYHDPTPFQPLKAAGKAAASFPEYPQTGQDIHTDT